MPQKTYHYICEVFDSLDGNYKVHSAFTDQTNSVRAVNYFKRNYNMKPYLGNRKYKIVMRMNPVVIQDVA